MRSLSWKLGGALLLIVIVSVGLMAYLTNLSTAREFRNYVIQGNTMHASGVGDSLSGFYSRQGNWNGVQGVLPGLLRMNGDRLIVADISGIIVGDTDGNALGDTVNKLGIAGYGTPVMLSEKQIGTFYFLYSGTGGMMGGMITMMGGQPIPTGTNTAEADFLSRVNRSLWITGLVAAAIALLVGLFLTRQITSPVRALTRGAREISQGNLAYRVKAESGDEVGELVKTFNTMAANLAASEQSRRRMTADIAHELRTPLTIVEGTVDGMLDGVFAPDREHLATIKEQTALLTRLIGDLRELSLAEAGQLKLELAPDDIVRLVRGKLEQVELTARDKGISLKLEAEDNLSTIEIDHMRIEQVVANLLTNAIHHTPPGGIITVSVKAATPSADNQRGILISVVDTGEGIAVEHLPHIFERFYRVSDSRSRSEGGTGLGLAIVKHLVLAHQGRVWAESEPGKGSRFRVFLPLKASSPQNASPKP
ncbi:MAG: integral rane sensor signal transduction histidine kinase [Dehalococcoidales bacterium]|nr:integral rane sensor signal transduction histidine kinase [Dehalococcoidales bacterium]